MRILALDQSTAQTGYAIGETGQNLRSFYVSSFRTPKLEDFADRLAHIHRTLCDLIEKHKPDLIAYETPFMPVQNQKFGRGDAEGSAESRQAVFSVDVIRKLHYVAGGIMTVASLYGIPCEDYASSSWRHTHIGVGRAPKGAEKDYMKRAALKRASQLGYKLGSHDAADALGILVHALCGPPAAKRAQGNLLDGFKL